MKEQLSYTLRQPTLDKLGKTASEFALADAAQTTGKTDWRVLTTEKLCQSKYYGDIVGVVLERGEEDGTGIVRRGDELHSDGRESSDYR